MNTKQLRQKILDLAIRGKLVPQDPNDEPASVLLERVRAEKERLIKEGKIKRDKKDNATASCDDKAHYGQLPQGWAWIKLSSIAAFAGGKTPSTNNNDFWNGTVNWATSKDMKVKYIDATQIKMSHLGARQMQMFNPNTLLIVVRSGILRRTLPLAILRVRSTINQDLKAISFYLDNVCEYCYYYFSTIEQEILTKYQKDGTTVESINFENFQEIEIPFPPLAEQRRIVSAIESAFAVIDKIERNKADLQAAVATAKRKTLSLAISGKLVPQDLNDEPASALLERIRAEREALGKAGKSKRGKVSAAAPRSGDRPHYGNVPFELPDTWELVRVSDVFIVNPRNVVEDFITVSFVPMTLIDDGFANHFAFQEKTWGEIKSGFTHFQDGDVGLAKITPCLENRKSVVFRELMNGIGAGTTELHIFRPICVDTTIPDYLLWFIKSERFVNGCINAFSGAVGQQRISKDYVSNTFIPLPPFAEQRRIVSAIETTFKQLDSIVMALT